MVVYNSHLYTNMYLVFFQLKMIEARFCPKIKFEPTFFQVLWRFAFSLPFQGEAGGRGVLGEIPPALQILGEISSNFFERTPPVGKRRVWLARYAGSPADFRREIEFLFLFREAKR